MSGHDAVSDNDSPAPGTAPAAEIEKAGCGIRFSDDELQEGIDFSNANQLLPGSPDDNDDAITPS